MSLNSIKNIFKMDILEKNGIIIIHRKKGDLDTYPKKFKVIRNDSNIKALEKGLEETIKWYNKQKK